LERLAEKQTAENRLEGWHYSEESVRNEGLQEVLDREPGIEQAIESEKVKE
jgi:hypothetical protein